MQRRDRFGDPLPQGALYRIGTTRLQHGTTVRALAASPDGKLLAAASQDRMLILWDVASGRDVRRLLLGPDADRFLAFTPDSKSLLCNTSVPVSGNSTLCRLDVASGEVRRMLGESARGGVIAADGKTATVIQNRGLLWSPAIRRWDLATGKVLKEWTLQPEPPASTGVVMPGVFSVDAQLSPDGTLLATIETDHSRPDKVKQTLRLHAVATGKELHRWDIPAPRVHDLTLSNDGKFIILGSGDSTLRVCDAATGKELRRWRADPPDPLGIGMRLAMTPDGDSVIVTGPGMMMRWDWRTGKQLNTYPGMFAPVAFLHGGKAIAVHGSLNSLYVLDTATGKDLTPVPRPGHYLGFSRDGRHIAWSEGGDIVLGNAATGAVERRWPSRGTHVGRLRFSPDGGVLASSTGQDHRLCLWDAGTGREIRTLTHRWVQWAHFSRDGKRLASVAGWHGDLRLWDCATGTRRGEWQGGQLVACDPDVRIVAVADSKNKTLRLFDIASGKLLHALPGYQERLSCYYQTTGGVSGSRIGFPPCFSPDGRLLLAGSERADGDPAGIIQFWDVATGRRRASILDGRQFHFVYFAFSPDSRLLALTRYDRTKCLMNTATGKVVRTLGRADGVMTAPPVFTPDGRTLITAVNGRVQVWEVATGAELCRREGHGGDIDALEMSGDGRAVASAALDNTILVWDLTRLLPGDPLPFESAWAGLASTDAVKARRAIESLTAAPADAVALLRKRLPPVSPADPRQLARWIADLGSDDFDERRRAMDALDRLGEMAGTELQKARAAGPPLEARRRIDELLRKHDPDVLPLQALRAVRAVQVLEMIDSPAARTLLQTLADGAAGARLTREATGALGRMRDRTALPQQSGAAAAYNSSRTTVRARTTSCPGLTNSPPSKKPSPSCVPAG